MTERKPSEGAVKAADECFSCRDYRSRWPEIIDRLAVEPAVAERDKEWCRIAQLVEGTSTREASDIFTERDRQIADLQARLEKAERDRDELREGWRQSVIQKKVNLLPETEAAVHIAELEQDRDAALGREKRLQEAVRAFAFDRDYMIDPFTTPQWQALIGLAEGGDDADLR